MMWKVCLSLFSCLTLYFCYSQNISKINSFKIYCLARNTLPKLQNNSLAVSTFNNYLDIALKTPDEYIHKEAYKAAAYYFAQTDTVLAFKYVKAAVNYGAEIKCINGVFTPSELLVLQKIRIDYIRRNYNPDVFSFFENLRMLDQHYRNRTNPDDKKKMNSQDKVNQLLLTNFIKKNNWFRHSAFDTADCNHTISSSLGSMISHWDIPYSNFIYTSMVQAAQQNKLPWFIPITTNNLFFTRKPFAAGTYYNFLNWLLSYNQLNNLKLTVCNEIDMVNDFTIIEILSMCFRSYKSNDIICLIPSRKFANNKENCSIQLKKLRKALLFFGLKEWQVTIFDFEKYNSSLPDSVTPIGYWNIHYGPHPTVSGMYKDTWILDNEFSVNDFNNLFK